MGMSGGDTSISALAATRVLQSIRRADSAGLAEADIKNVLALIMYEQIESPLRAQVNEARDRLKALACLGIHVDETIATRHQDCPQGQPKGL